MIFLGNKAEEKERILFLKKMVKNINTLDMGSAEGLLTRHLVDSEKVVAIDVYDDEISQNPAKTKIIGDIRKLPFKNNQFDQIFLFEVIEHQEFEKDRSRTLKEARRVLKTGGNLILSTPNKKRLSYYLRRIVGKSLKFPYLIGKDPKRIFGNYHYLEYTSKEIKDLCYSAGFSNVVIENYYLQIPYICLFFKIKSILCPTLFIKCKK